MFAKRKCFYVKSMLNLTSFCTAFQLSALSKGFVTKLPTEVEECC